VALPPQLAAALTAVMGEPVGHVVIVEHAWLMLLHGRMGATTRRSRIYLRGSAGGFYIRPEMVLHEYYHVLRQWETGRLTTRRYLAESLRRSYRNNRFEIEARTFAAQHAPALEALLARPIPGLPT
jgi:hypothetical protein